MGFTFRALCQVLFIHRTLQCYQARLEFSDQGFEDIGSAYRDLNDEASVLQTDVQEGSSDRERKGTKWGELDTEVNNMRDNRRENSEIYVDSEEKRRANQLRRANAEKRRNSNREIARTRHLNRLRHQRKGSDILENPIESENSDHSVDVAHYYLTKPSDIANMSAMLGPGPVSIQFADTTTEEKTTVYPFTINISPISVNETKLTLEKVRSSANLSLEGYEVVPLIGEHKRGHKGKLKSHNTEEENDELILINQPKKKRSRSHKQKSIHTTSNDRSNDSPRRIHKKRKYKKMHNEAINRKKDVEKSNFNEEDQFTNLSVINKSFQNVISKKFNMKGSEVNPTDGESQLEKDEATMVVDKISDEDAQKLCLLSAEREINEEEHTSLRHGTPDHDNDEYVKPRSNPRKGIKSKIEHGDWLDQVTLIPLPDYSVRKNRTHHKKLSLSEDKKETLLGGSSSDDEKIPINNKNYKIRKSVAMKDLPSFDKISKRFKGQSEPQVLRTKYSSNVLYKNDGETENKRDERDVKTRVERNDFKMPRLRSIFNRHSASDENVEETYDVDTKQDDQSYSSFKNKNENTNNKLKTPEGAEEEYEYDAQLNGDEKCVTAVSIKNRTVSPTHSTCSSIPSVVQSINPTEKTNQPKATLKPERKLGGINVGIGKMNETIDPYQQFLCGRLADDFVNEVLKKVKKSRKISRELGYSNETEETCDRCIELKPIKIPEPEVMRGSLGKCLKSYNPVQNCSMCCSVPKPMLRYLNTLVYFEKENENNFYSKIQDDSTFIFTGDYPESLLKGDKGMKINEKYDDERSSFNKDTSDRQLFRDDTNEEKNEDQIPDSDRLEKANGKLSTRLRSSGEDAVSNSEDVFDRDKATEGEVKRNLGTFVSSKMSLDNEGKHPDLQDSMKDKFDGVFNFRGAAPSAKDYVSKEATYPHHTRSFGKSRKNCGNEKINEIDQNTVNKPRNYDKTPIRNFDRYYDNSNYDLFKQYPPKHSPVNPHFGYTSNNQLILRNPLSKDQEKDGDVYQLPNSNGMLNSVNDNSNFNDNYFGYPPRKYIEGNKPNKNGNYKGYEQKYDFPYEDSGEYSLYPNFDDKGREGDVGSLLDNYENNGGDNTRMVKRDTQPLPLYDDEPNVFFEIPDIEYDLYK